MIQCIPAVEAPFKKLQYPVQFFDMQNISSDCLGKPEKSANTHQKADPVFSDEEIKNILEFLGCLKDISEGLLREGYCIEGNVFVPSAIN